MLHISPQEDNYQGKLCSSDDVPPFWIDKIVTLLQHEPLRDELGTKRITDSQGRALADEMR